jgi:uncharacterized membrane protein
MREMDKLDECMKWMRGKRPAERRRLLVSTILLILFILGLIVIGQLGGSVFHLLLAVATLFLVIQLFCEDGRLT